MTSAFGIRIDIDDVTRLAQQLSNVNPEELGRVLVQAINATADSTYELGRKTILNGINLTDEYIKRKMQVDHATEARPVATITAFAGRGFITSLSHYGAMQLTSPVNWSNARIQASGHKFGAWPGWTKRKGNAALGIAPDSKGTGRSVEVVRGSRKKIGPAFAIPGKADNDGNPIVFRRNRGSSKVEALTGPSVYQLFRVAAGKIEDQIGDDLEQAVVEVARRHMQGIE